MIIINKGSHINATLLIINPSLENTNIPHSKEKYAINFTKYVSLLSLFFIDI